MNLSQLIKEVRTQLDEPDSEGFFTNENIISKLNEAEKQVAIITEFNKKRAEMELNEEGQVWELPPGFIKEFRVLYNQNKLDKVEFGNTTNSGYFIWGEELHLNFEGIGGKLEVYYSKLPEPMEEDNDIPELPEKYHNLLVNYALYRLKMQDEKYNEAEFYKNEYVEGLQVMSKRMDRPPRKKTFTVERR